MGHGVKLFIFMLFLGKSILFRIGAFNLKVFGLKKAQDTEVIEHIVKIIQRYDIILLQEIRDSSGESITLLQTALNRGPNLKYDKVVSPRLGDSVSKEQYAFFYRSESKITVVSSYIYDDPQNTFEREPYIVKFNVPVTVISEFVLAGIHIRPSAAIEEIAALETVQEDIVSRMKNTHILFLGDMNAECSYAPKYKLNEIPIRKSPSYHWLIDDNVDTTVSKGTDCAYDRFILYGDKFLSTVVKDSAGSFEFDKEFKLTDTQAIAVSDHYPIELELKTLSSKSSISTANSGPFIPYTMFSTMCLAISICSCIYCFRGKTIS